MRRIASPPHTRLATRNALARRRHGSRTTPAKSQLNNCDLAARSCPPKAEVEGSNPFGSASISASFPAVSTPRHHRDRT